MMQELEDRVVTEIMRVGGDERLNNFIKHEFKLCRERHNESGKTTKIP